MVEVTKEVKPETTREIEIPAEYAEFQVRKLDQEAKEREVDVPEEYKVLTRREKIGDLRSEWRSVLCEINVTADTVTTLQLALNKENACQSDTSSEGCLTVDGHLGPNTLNAVQRFAKKKGLSSGNNYVTMEVVSALGLNF